VGAYPRVPAGVWIDVKAAATGGTRDLEIAYDTATYTSSLTLP
jgi:hypothetical protein